MPALSPRSLLLLAAIVAAHALAIPAPKKHAVVVGAGPVGMAAALTLASPRHNYTVTVLESSSASSWQKNYDPTKAYLYNINERGMRLTKQLPIVQKKLEETSVPSYGFSKTKFTVVPADPDEEIPAAKTNVGDPNAKKAGAIEGEKLTAEGYWLQRHEFVKLMAECIEDHNAKSDCNIEVLTGQECVDVLPTNQVGQNVVCVKSRNSDGSLSMHQATLCIGADGMDSKVRQCLAAAPTNLWQSHRGFDPRKFRLKQYTSPASHLRIKILQLPPQLEIPNAKDLPPLKTTSEELYSLRSANTGPRNFLKLGLLPMKDNNAIRPTNVITRPDHDVWKIKDGPAMREFFRKAFPRLNFDEDGGLVSSAEWDRFAKAEGTRFPYCQHSEGLAVWDESGTCGVALVGDAMHAFPPDIGQGINAGLTDVVALDRALQGLDANAVEETGKDSAGAESLRAGLERYQKERSPEIAALIRLARFGAPYQYSQPHLADKILQKLWLANVLVRMILSKLTFGLVQPSCIFLSTNPNLTYRQVMRRADRTTALLKTAVLGALGVWIKQRYGFGFLATMMA